MTEKEAKGTKKWFTVTAVEMQPVRCISFEIFASDGEQAKALAAPLVEDAAPRDYEDCDQGGDPELIFDVDLSEEDHE